MSLATATKGARLPRVGTSVLRRPGPIALTGLFLLASVLLARYSLRVHTWQPDEQIYVFEGRTVAHHFPSALWDPQVFKYGIERLGPLLIALAAWLFSDTGTAMEATKVIMAIVFASACIPWYLLGRGLGLAWPWALLGAATTVALPWLPLATSFLNDPVAYAGFAWAVYTAWRAAAQPGWRNDVLALIGVAAAAFARSNLAALAVVPVLAVLLSEIRFGGAARSAQAARAALVRHLPLIAMVVAGGVYLLVRGTGSLSGIYAVDFTPNLGKLLDQSGAFVGFVVQGLTLAAAGVALAWIVGQIVRPSDRAGFALGLVAGLAGVMLLYSLHSGVREERYIFELAPLMTVLATIAVVRRDVSPVLVAAGGAAMALLVSGADHLGDPNGGYVPLAYPGQGWWQVVVQKRASVYLPGGVLSRHAETVLLIGLPVVATIGIALVRYGGRRLALGTTVALVGAQVVLGAGAGAWALTKYIHRSGDEHGPDVHARAWIDRALSSNQIGNVPFYTELGLSEGPDLAEMRFWNASAGGSTINSIDELAARFDLRNGRAVANLPDALLINGDRLQRLGLLGRPLAASPNRPIQLWRTSPSTRLAWLVDTPSTDGWLPPRAHTVIHLWGACLAMTLTAPPDSPSNVRLRSADGNVRKLRLPPQQSIQLKTTSPGTAQLWTQGRGTLPPLRYVSGLLTGLQQIPCGT